MSNSFEMTSLILISILSQRKILRLTPFWQGIDIAQVSFLWFWCHFTFEVWFLPAFLMSKQAFMTSLILTGGVISIKMLSLFIYGHKKRSSKGCNCLQSFDFCWYSVVMTYLRGFQLVRIFFQPERIARVFNLREWG